MCRSNEYYFDCSETVMLLNKPVGLVMLNTSDNSGSFKVF